MSEAVMEAEVDSTQEVSAPDDGMDFLQDSTPQITTDFASEATGQATEPAESEATQETEAEQPTGADEVQSQLDALQKRYDNAQQLISRQGQELGTLRPIAQKEDIDPTKYLEDFANEPVKAQRELIQQELQNRDAQVHQQEMVALQSKGLVLQHVPDAESLIPQMQEWYTKHGADASFVQNLSQSIYNNVDTAVALAENIQAQAEIVELKAELAKSRGAVDGKIDRIQEIAKKGRTISAGTGGGAPDATLDTSNLSTKSTAQLRELLSRSQS